MDGQAAVLRTEIDQARTTLRLAERNSDLLSANDQFATVLNSQPLFDLVNQYDRLDQDFRVIYKSDDGIDFIDTLEHDCKLGPVPVPGIEGTLGVLFGVDIVEYFRLWAPQWSSGGLGFSGSFSGEAKVDGAVQTVRCPFDGAPSIAVLPGTYPFPPMPTVIRGTAIFSAGDNGKLQIGLKFSDLLTAALYQDAAMKLLPTLPIATIDNPLKTVFPILLFGDKGGDQLPLCFRVVFVTNSVTPSVIGPRLSGVVSIIKIPADAVSHSCPSQ